MRDEVALPEWCTVVRADNSGPLTLEGTNTYVLHTKTGNVVVDPGPPERVHEDRTPTPMTNTPARTAHTSTSTAHTPARMTHTERVRSYGKVAQIVVTHHHEDHNGCSQLLHEMTGAPVLARDPDLCLGDQVPPSDGALLDVPELSVRVLDTPGHTADSISLLVTDVDRQMQVLFSGDTVLGRGTTFVAHPDGRLGSYLESLDRLFDVVGDECILAPGHGPLRANARAVITSYISHRHKRLEQIQAALASGGANVSEIVDIVYADVDGTLRLAAEKTVQAALDYLTQEK